MEIVLFGFGINVKWLFFVALIAYVVYRRWVRVEYSPRKLTRGSARANGIQEEVDKMLSITFGFLKRRPVYEWGRTFSFKEKHGCVWILTLHGAADTQLECKMGDGVVYSFRSGKEGNWREESSPLAVRLKIYQSLGGLLKDMAKTFPSLEEDFKLLRLAAEL
jgi:hypothetical protein